MIDKLTALVTLAAMCAMSPLAAQATWVGHQIPYPRWDVAMGYDPVRGKVVMFGGNGVPARSRVAHPSTWQVHDGTWEWDGVRWTLRQPLHSPPARRDAMLAFDPVRKAMILYGGYDENVGTTPYADTWEWDGHDWRQLQPSSSPGPRFASGMATDFARNRIILFGGGTIANFQLFGSVGATAETWEWDGNNWARANPTTVPSARLHMGMAFCAVRGRVTMYGGSDGRAHAAPTTWEWTGADWYAHPGSSPVGKRARHGMSSEPATGHVVLFGGNDDQTGRRETWRWDGTTWIHLQPAHQPSIHGDSDSTMCPDVRGSILSRVHWGGEFGRWLMHSWDGNDWNEADTAQQFWRQCRPVYDAANDRTVIVSPEYLHGQVPIQTWQYVDGELSRLTLPVEPQTDPQVAVVYHAGIGAVVAYFRPIINWTTAARDQQTWLLDKSGWRQRNTAHVPGTPDDYVHLAYDTKRKRVVAHLPRVLQTWVFDGVDWRQLPTTTSPKTAFGTPMVYDAHRDRMVLMHDSSLATIYEFDGVDWSLVPTPGVPNLVAYRGPIGYHPGLKKVVFCEEEFSALRFTWDGQTFAPLQTTEPLTYGIGMGLARLVYDSRRQRLRALYVGIIPSTENVWDLILERLTVDDHLARLGSTLTYRAEFRGHGGQRWLLALSGQTRPSIPLYDDPDYGVVDLPLAPTLLLQASVGANLGGTLDAQGIGTATVTIPNDPALVDYGFDAAAVTVDLPRAKITGVSNPVHVWVVR